VTDFTLPDAARQAVTKKTRDDEEFHVSGFGDNQPKNGQKRNVI